MFINGILEEKMMQNISIVRKMEPCEEESEQLAISMLTSG